VPSDELPVRWDSHWSKSNSVVRNHVKSYDSMTILSFYMSYPMQYVVEAGRILRYELSSQFWAIPYVMSYPVQNYRQSL
jgi:hypothetical protein